MSVRTIIIPGTVIEEVTLQTTQARVRISQHTSGDIEVETSGTVLAVAGGGAFQKDHPTCEEVRSLTKKIAAAGGIIVNGGENNGTMLTTAETAPHNTLGVACPYHKLIPHINKAIVSNYQSRKMIISAMPQVAVFEGQVGTFEELVTAIGWIKSLTKQGNIPPVVWVHHYWSDLMVFLKEKNTLQKNVEGNIHEFTHVDEITF